MAEANNDPANAPRDYDSPLINGERALTVETVQQWRLKAHAPVFTEASALVIARALNDLKLQTVLWHPAFAGLRRSNPSAQRLRRIAEALEILRADLPLAIADLRRIEPNAPRLPVEELFDLANAIAPAAARFLPKRGALATYPTTSPST